MRDHTNYMNKMTNILFAELVDIINLNSTPQQQEDPSYGKMVVASLLRIAAKIALLVGCDILTFQDIAKEFFLYERDNKSTTNRPTTFN